MSKAWIVIPAYNESRRLPHVLRGMNLRVASMRENGFDVRFLIVDDGSSPDESARMQSLVRDYGLAATVSVLRLEVNRGKGGAIQAGFMEGFRFHCDYIGFMDADGSVSVSELHRLLTYLRNGSHAALAAAVGSRVQMLGRQVLRNNLRHYLGRIFATFVSVYFGSRIYDSQCGLKVFRADVVRRYLHVPLDSRWAWDTQLILSLLHFGEVVHEVPIDWKEVGGSKVSFLKDPLMMFFHLIRLKKRLVGMSKPDQPNLSGAE